MAWGFTVFALVFTILDDDGGTAEWMFAPLMAALMLVASSGRLGRRPREVAIAVTFVVTQIFLSRYVGNITGFGAIYIIVLSFYQDWVPIATSCVGALLLLLLAAVDPRFFADDLGFAREDAFTGMGFRTLAVLVAAGLALVVWRSGTQIRARPAHRRALSRPGSSGRSIATSQRGRMPAVWACDIDNFRSVNAELGPAAGDLVLRHVAASSGAWGRASRGGSLCARLGGDNFLLATHDDPGAAFVEEFAHQIKVPVAADRRPRRPDPAVGRSGHRPRGRDGKRADPGRRAGMRKAKVQGNMRVVVEQRGSERLPTRRLAADLRDLPGVRARRVRALPAARGLARRRHPGRARRASCAGTTPRAA